MVNAPFDPNTNLEEHRDHPKDFKSVFIWLDILGFSNDVEGAQNNEEKYTQLQNNLKSFQKIFNKGTVAKNAFAGQAGIDDAESESIWNNLKEKGVFDDRGKIKIEIAINQVNVNSWLAGKSEDVKVHVLGILQQESNNIKSTIISDGILLELKLYSSIMVEDVFDFIDDIGEAQLTFFKENSKLIRGGIAVANSVKENTENGVFLTYGLSGAVKMEKKVCWPIIGMDEDEVDELAGIFSMNSDTEKVLKDIKEKFKKTYNSNGDLIYFIDFLNGQSNIHLESLIQDKFDQKDKANGTTDNKVVLKYSWLYRYYISKIQPEESFLKEVKSGALIL